MSNSYFQRERVFIIHTNGAIYECNTFEDAMKINDKKITIIDKYKETFIEPNSGYLYRVSEFIFKNNNDESTQLKNNSWTIHAIDYEYKGSSEIKFVVKFSDPLNRVRNIRIVTKRDSNYSHPDSHDLIIVTLIIEKLNELSKFHNWEQIDLDSENKKIKDENNKLKREIELLKLK